MASARGEIHTKDLNREAETATKIELKKKKEVKKKKKKRMKKKKSPAHHKNYAAAP